MKRSIFFWIITATIGTILLLLLNTTIKLEKQVEDEIFKTTTADILAIAQNKAMHIQTQLESSEHFLQTIKKSPHIQSHIEDELKVMITENIKYAYILYKDDKGILRFLVDASTQDKASLGQKFDIHNPQWIDIFVQKKPQTITHSLFQELSMTYLVPILFKKEVKLILAVDFSIKKIQNIQNIIVVMKKGIIAIIAIIALALLTFIVQTIRYKAIKESSQKDPLTGIYNRKYLQEIQEKLPLEKYVLAALDIDHFKHINDTYGHDIGDSVLKELALIMQNSIRNKEDILIRYGGEEFVILAKVDKGNRTNAKQVIERIFSNIQQHKLNVTPEATIQVTVSIGLHLYPHYERGFEQAFKEADKALYLAKGEGRNQIVYVKSGIPT